MAGWEWKPIDELQKLLGVFRKRSTDFHRNTGADLAYAFAFGIIIVDYKTFYNGIPLLARHLHTSFAAKYFEL